MNAYVIVLAVTAGVFLGIAVVVTRLVVSWIKGQESEMAQMVVSCLRCGKPWAECQCGRLAIAKQHMVPGQLPYGVGTPLIIGGGSTLTPTKPGIITEDVADIARLDAAMIQATVEAVVREVERQDVLARQRRFGGTHILPSGPNLARLGVLTEEVGEVAKECNEELMTDPYEPNVARVSRLHTELIQVAACAVAWATALEEGR